MTGHQEHPASAAPSHEHNAMPGAYRALAIEVAIDFVLMYLAMYAMIATLDHFYLNLGNVYMTLLMVAPMLAVMLWAMRGMFPSRRSNTAVLGIAAVLFATGWIGMRQQVGVGDRQFLRSMIPHHSGAILMCREASLTDPRIVELCRGIIAGQSREIAQMEALLREKR